MSLNLQRVECCQGESEKFAQQLLQCGDKVQQMVAEVDWHVQTSQTASEKLQSCMETLQQKGKGKGPKGGKKRGGW